MGSSLGKYHYAVKGLRMSASSKSLKPYITDSPIDSSDLVDNETEAQVPSVKGKAPVVRGHSGISVFRHSLSLTPHVPI